MTSIQLATARPGLLMNVSCREGTRRSRPRFACPVYMHIDPARGTLGARVETPSDTGNSASLVSTLADNVSCVVFPLVLIGSCTS